jgi:long-chain acyl-CoA synthetase
LFKKGVDSKKYYYENQGALNYKLYDWTVFNKVKQEFGGNCRIMLTSSAPITPEVLTFFKIALGINVFECYG